MLKSVEGVAEEIVLVDSGSTDGTVEIARAAGVRVLTRTWTNYSDQRNYCASVASEHWILVIAPDEELSEELRNAILDWKKSESKFFVYEFARMAWFLGGWIHHSRWYPDWQRRLYDRRKASFAGAIHEAVRFEGEVGRLRGDLLHYTARNLADQKKKGEEYSAISARAMFENGRRSWRAAKWLASPWAWIQYFVLGAGFLDGYRGFVIAGLAAQTVWMKYSKLGVLVEKAKRGKK